MQLLFIFYLLISYFHAAFCLYLPVFACICLLCLFSSGLHCPLMKRKREVHKHKHKHKHKHTKSTNEGTDNYQPPTTLNGVLLAHGMISLQLNNHSSLPGKATTSAKRPPNFLLGSVFPSLFLISLLGKPIHVPLSSTLLFKIFLPVGIWMLSALFFSG